TGQSRTLAVNVRNGGNGPLMITALTVAGNSAFGLVSPAPPVGVAPGALQVISLRFSPTASGTQTGTLTIESNDPNRGRVTVNLTGNGTTPTQSLTPRISGLIPGSLPQGTRRFDLTVSGSNFSTASTVNVNGSPRPTRFLGSGLLRASIAPEDVASAGTAQV